MAAAEKDTMAALDDVSQVNMRIQLLERERETAQALASGQTAQQHSNDGTQRARDLASQLEAAIRSGDLATLDTLALSFGEIQSIAAAKNLILEKTRLTEQRTQRVAHDEISRELSQVIDYDFDLLKALKTRISGLNDTLSQSQLQSSIDTVVLSYREEYTAKLVDELSKSHWTKSNTIPDSLTAAFTDLINLQSLLTAIEPYPQPLWAFATVAENFKVSFDYHFNTDKDTNRIDRPELFLTYLLKYLSNHIKNINIFFHLQKTELTQSDAHTEFITAALVPVREKLQQCITTLRGSAADGSDDIDLRLLIHLIHEVVSFDEVLVREFYYDPFNNGMWPGLFDVFEYRDLERWLNLEIRLSLQNFESIVNGEDVFQIDYDSVGANELKPTVSAIKMKNVFDGTTRTFQKFFIPNYAGNNALQKFKLKLFSKLYLKFLELYYARLLDGYHAFESLFKSTRSLLQTTKGDVDISGVNGLERLFRLYGSLKYVTKSLNVWNHELIFVELNELYNLYANTKSDSLFSSIVGDYQRLQEAVFKLIVDFYNKTMQSLLKGYANLNTWNSSTPTQQLSLSNELVPLIDKIQELNTFSGKVLSPRDITVIKNATSFFIADFIFQHIFKGNHFNKNGVKQLELDFATVWERLTLKRNFPIYQKLVQGLKLLNMTDDQAYEMGYASLNQLAQSGNFAILRETIGLDYLRDGDIFDIMLRIH